MINNQLSLSFDLPAIWQVGFFIIPTALEILNPYTSFEI